MFTFYSEGFRDWKPRKFTVTFPDLAEPVEITLDMDRHSPDWKGLYKLRPTEPPPEPSRPEASRGVSHTPEDGRAKPLRGPHEYKRSSWGASRAENPDDVQGNPSIWLFTLILIGIIGGVVVARRYFKKDVPTKN